MATMTRADLREAVLREIGLSRRESAEFVDSIIEAIADRLEAGEVVKISGFGTFTLRDKGERLGRNPKTREPAPISARRVVVFKPSAVLRGGWPRAWLVPGMISRCGCCSACNFDPADDRQITGTFAGGDDSLLFGWPRAWLVPGMISRCGCCSACKMSELPVEAPLLVGADALLDVFLAFGHHQVDEAGEFAGGRLDRNGGVHSGEPCAVLGADEGLAAARGHGRHAQGLPDGVDRLRGLAGEVLAAADPGSRRERKPGAEVLGGGEGGEVRADLRGDHPVRYRDRRWGIAVRSTPIILRNARGWMPSLPVSLVAAFAERLDAVSEVVPGAGSGAPPSGGSSGGARRSISAITRASQSSICWGQEVVALHGLFEGEQMLLAPRPLKARGDRIGVGLDAPVAQRRQALWVTLAVDDRAQDALAGQSRDVGDHRVELDVHLGQRLLHVQDAAGSGPRSARLIWRA